MSGAHESQALDLSTSQLVRDNADLLVSLPAPDEWWFYEDVDLPHSKFQQFNAKGLIEHYGTQKAPSSNSRDQRHRWRWVVDEAVYERAQEMVDRRDALLPCGHAGLCNVAEGFVCGFEFCDQIFERAEVQQ